MGSTRCFRAQVSIAALCPLHGANFWKILQLWAHIYVEIPFNCLQTRVTGLYSNVLNCQSRMKMRSSDVYSFLRRQQCQSAFGILCCKKHRTKIQRVSYNPLAYAILRASCNMGMAEHFKFCMAL